MKSEKIKIEKKQKESTAMEKRNTSIAVFAGFALIPLLLTFLLGFSMSNAKSANHSKLVKEVTRLKNKADSLQREKAAIEKTAIKLSGIFSTGDSLLEDYKKTLSLLKGELNDIEDIQGSEDWDDKLRTAKSDFKDYTSEMRIITKNKNIHLKKVHDVGLEWLGNFSNAKEKELAARRREIEHRISQGKISEAETLIAELEDKLEDKEKEIDDLKDDLKYYTKESSEDRKDIEEELKDAQKNAKEIKKDIIKKVDEIRDDIVLKIEGQRFWQMKNTKKEVNSLKDQLKIKLDKIESHAKDLD